MPGVHIIRPRLLKKQHCSESCHRQTATDTESSSKLFSVSSTETTTLRLDGPCSITEWKLSPHSPRNTQNLLGQQSRTSGQAGPGSSDMQELTAGLLLQQLPLAVDDAQDQQGQKHRGQSAADDGGQGHVPWAGRRRGQRHQVHAPTTCERRPGR